VRPTGRLMGEFSSFLGFFLSELEIVGFVRLYLELKNIYFVWDVALFII